MRRLSHVAGIDDAPFGRKSRGDVMVVAAVFAGLRMDGVLTAKVRRDGANATRVLCDLIAGSRFASHLQAILLQGIALAGFNVVDIQRLHEELHLPVLVVARRRPNMGAVHHALIERVRGGHRKWAVIERTGAMEPLAGVWVQRAGISIEQAHALLARFTIHGHIPEPIRAAHLIAGGLTTGQSRGRA